MRWSDQKKAAALVEDLKRKPQACGFFLRKGYFFVSHFSTNETIANPLLLHEKLCRFKTANPCFWDNLAEMLAKHFNFEVPARNKDFDAVTVTIRGDGVILYERPATLREDKKLNINFRKLKPPTVL